MIGGRSSGCGAAIFVAAPFLGCLLVLALGPLALPLGRLLPLLALALALVGLAMAGGAGLIWWAWAERRLAAEFFDGTASYYWSDGIGNLYEYGEWTPTVRRKGVVDGTHQDAAGRAAGD